MGIETIALVHMAPIGVVMLLLVQVLQIWINQEAVEIWHPLPVVDDPVILIVLQIVVILLALLSQQVVEMVMQPK